MACIWPCPTGSIDNWRTLPRIKAYSIEEQLGWDELPAEWTPQQLESQDVTVGTAPIPNTTAAELTTPDDPAPFDSAAYGATMLPWSAAHAYTHLSGRATSTFR